MFESLSYQSNWLISRSNCQPTYNMLYPIKYFSAFYENDISFDFTTHPPTPHLMLNTLYMPTCPQPGLHDCVGWQFYLEWLLAIKKYFHVSMKLSRTIEIHSIHWDGSAIRLQHSLWYTLLSVTRMSQYFVDTFFVWYSQRFLTLILLDSPWLMICNQYFIAILIELMTNL